MRAEPPGKGMTVADLGEFGLIRRVTESRKQPAGTLLGPGDDAAVVAAPDGRVVASTDVLVQGVHFRLDWSAPEQVGRKAVAVNLADIVAMGAVPTTVLVGLACPPDTPTSLITELVDGMWAEAAKAGIGVSGGDMVGADPVQWVLTGGEDHALAATFPPFTELPDGWRTIGVVTMAESGITVDG